MKVLGVYSLVVMTLVLIVVVLNLFSQVTGRSIVPIFLFVPVWIYILLNLLASFKRKES